MLPYQFVFFEFHDTKCISISVLWQSWLWLLPREMIRSYKMSGWNGSSKESTTTSTMELTKLAPFQWEPDNYASLNDDSIVSVKYDLYFLVTSLQVRTNSFTRAEWYRPPALLSWTNRLLLNSKPGSQLYHGQNSSNQERMSPPEENFDWQTGVRVGFAISILVFIINIALFLVGAAPLQIWYW